MISHHPSQTTLKGEDRLKERLPGNSGGGRLRLGTGNRSYANTTKLRVSHDDLYMAYIETISHRQQDMCYNIIKNWPLLLVLN